ncbi:hypothetical protein CK623_13625 [Vandammella animalimorsus]|uniref:Uncharacterized protein n=1 Tax=Vandammella animalimorsus TaxID=2029117 RepID=A0A2A2AG59_9BURK|nr:hypothetical protein CK623_13625 [Vandammella animalimorsus]
MCARRNRQSVFFSNVDKSKTWPLTGVAISQVALVMPAKAGIQRHTCAREGGLANGSAAPSASPLSASRLDTRLRGCDENQLRLQEMSL